MASLKFIMDVDDEQPDLTQSHLNKKDKEPSAPSASGSRGQGQESSSSTPLSHVASSGQHNERNLSPAAQGSAPGKRRATSNRVSKATTTASSSSSSRPSAARRRSTTSTDSMDQQGYASSSSMGGSAGGMPPNHPMRPMAAPSTGSELPIKLTPITGRVSRAKKGVPVHICDVCKPPKTFTRAEHLRRHQLSHETPRYPCAYPGCDRAFHRADLLARHQQKHDQEGDKASSSSGRGGQIGRRGSSQSLVEGASRMVLQPSGPSTAPPGPALGTTTPDVPPTPTPTNTQFPTGQQRGSTGPSNPSPISPSMGGRGSNYDPSNNRYEYVPESRNSIIYPSNTLGSASMPGQPNIHHGEYGVPRTPGVIPLFVVTQGLNNNPQAIDSNLPELSHIDASPWASSTDSSYSTTPATDSVRNQRYTAFIPRHSSPTNEWAQPNTMLSPYPPPSAVRDHAALDTLATPYFFETMPPSHVATQAHGHHNNFGFLDVHMDFPDSHALMGDSSSQSHPQNNHSSSVRSPSPVTTSTVSAETLVAPSPALPADRIGQLVSLGRQKEIAVDVGMGMYGGMPFGGGSGSSPGGILAAHGVAGMGGCGGGISLAMPLTSTVRRAIPGYLDVYWARFDVRFPIIHRPSFEAAAEDVLRCAMAAVATQFLDGKEDRIRGNQLHEYAWQEAKRCPHWNLDIMQAILLCEFFARFRGRKAVIKPSKPFESLYSRVLDYQTQAILFESDPPNQQAHLTTEQRWHVWVEAEARRRLLAACFFVDTHTSIYHEQARVHNFDLSNPGSILPIPLTGNTTALWDASSVDAWDMVLRCDPSTLVSAVFPDWDTLTPDEARAMPAFDRAITLAAEALRLPKRTVLNRGSALTSADPSARNTPERPGRDTSEAEDNISRVFRGCPIGNTYLALHHTPLHDLLAVSGDSWVFSHKVLPADSFLEHQKRLRSWTDSHLHVAKMASSSSSSSSPLPAVTNGMSAAKATIYAARALVAFLSRGMPDATCEGQRGWMNDISEYWAAYACALVCWAFGHRVMRGNDAAKGCSDEETVAWLSAVAEMQPEEVVKVRGRKEAFGVVGLLRRRLEVECIGGRSRLFVDAVGVLKKLEEGVNWKWF